MNSTGDWLLESWLRPDRSKIEREQIADSARDARIGSSIFDFPSLLDGWNEVEVRSATKTLVLRYNFREQVSLVNRKITVTDGVIKEIDDSHSWYKLNSVRD